MRPRIYRLSADDLVIAGQLNFRKRGYRARTLVFTIACLLILGGPWLLLDAAPFVLGAGLLGGIMALTLLFPMIYFWSIPRQMRKQYQQNPGLRDEMRLSWTEDILTLESERGRTTMGWRDYHRMVEGETLFLLYHSYAAYSPIPKTAVGDEHISAFRRLAAQANGPKPG